MMIAINKSFKKVPKTVWLIEGLYYTNKGKVVNPDTHYICTTDREVKWYMKSITSVRKKHNDRVEKGKINLVKRLKKFCLNEKNINLKILKNKLLDGTINPKEFENLMNKLNEETKNYILSGNKRDRKIIDKDHWLKWKKVTTNKRL